MSEHWWSEIYKKGLTSFEQKIYNQAILNSYQGFAPFFLTIWLKWKKKNCFLIQFLFSQMLIKTKQKSISFINMHFQGRVCRWYWFTDTNLRQNNLFCYSFSSSYYCNKKYNNKRTLQTLYDKNLNKNTWLDVHCCVLLFLCSYTIASTCKCKM